MRNRLTCLALVVAVAHTAPAQEPAVALAPDTSWVARSGLYEVFVRDFSPAGNFRGVIISTRPGDVAQVSFEIVDSAGTTVPTAGDLVRFTITGGSILALDNADLRDHDPYRSDRRHAFNGRGLAILAAPRPGLLRLTASAEGLRPASVSVHVMRGAGPQAVPAADRK